MSVERAAETGRLGHGVWCPLLRSWEQLATISVTSQHFLPKSEVLACMLEPGPLARSWKLLATYTVWLLQVCYKSDCFCWLLSCVYHESIGVYVGTVWQSTGNVIRKIRANQKVDVWWKCPSACWSTPESSSVDIENASWLMFWYYSGWISGWYQLDGHAICLQVVEICKLRLSLSIKQYYSNLLFLPYNCYNRDEILYERTAQILQKRKKQQCPCLLLSFVSGNILYHFLSKPIWTCIHLLPYTFLWCL